MAVFWCLVLAPLYSTVFVQSQVFVIPPTRQVAYSGAATDFECVSASQTTIQRIEWQINGSHFDNLAFNNIQQALLRSAGNNEIRGGVLSITNTSEEYNTTTVRCIVEFTTGSRETSDTTLLLIQGTLDVAELMVFVLGDSDEIFLNWTAPFTLLGASDITYCVDVVGTINRRTLHSECMINVTQFTFIMPHILVCEGLSFSVTPVNVVGNGTTSTVLTNLSSVPVTSPELVEVISVSTQILLIMSAPVCFAELRLVDVDTGEIITLGGTDVAITETNITLSTQQLIENRHYNVTVTASNIAGNSTSRIIIGVFNDIRNRALTTKSSELPQSESESESEPELDPKPELGNFTLTIGLIGGLVFFVLLAIIQSVVIVILCCKKRQKAPIQLGAQNLQLYEEVRDPEPTASSTAIVGRTSSRELAVPVPQYEDITLPAGVATKSGDPYQITQCSAYVVSNTNRI